MPPVFSQERKPVPEWIEKAAPDAALPKEPSGDVMVFRQERVQDPESSGGQRILLCHPEMSFDGKVVKGAPTGRGCDRVDADPGRWQPHEQPSASIYRDSEGRTRREQTLRALGPFAIGGEPPQTIVISDPVAGVNYMLDVRSKVARKTSPMRFNFTMKVPEGGVKVAPSGEDKIQTGPEPGKDVGEGIVITKEARVGEIGAVMKARVGGEPGMMKAPMGIGDPSGFVVELHDRQAKNAKKESLGEQLFDGVKAEGTRTTITIPAGEIGNERAIEMIMERWYSPELQTVVMTRHSDPRFGETVYKLININRSEPAKSLFEVPGDYTIKETPTPSSPTHMRMRKPPVEE